MLKVDLLSYDDLTETQKKGVSHNGRGAEWSNYVHVTHGGLTLFLESDAMEPEDASFHRDLSWVIGAIQRAYELGKADGSTGPRSE